jgi:hypothetical protein
MADGTAPQCGRVGSCHIYLKSLSAMKGFFVYNLSSFIQVAITSSAFSSS